MKKRRNGDICEGTLDTEFERDWSVGLGVMLGDGHTIFFLSFRDFSGKSRQCHIVEFGMHYKPTKFDQIRWSYF